VTRIAVTGKSNREIAEELWVTQKTVETHLSRAYRKLGIKTRAELGAALANDRGDIPDASVPTAG
jgi:DNA-binding CsgD family transcriptional regulator